MVELGFVLHFSLTTVTLPSLEILGMLVPLGSMLSCMFFTFDRRNELLIYLLG